MPDHPSWPAELVEKASRELWDHDEQAAANSLVRDRPYTVLSWEDADEVSREDYREQAEAVLAALSGDLVPREEHERASEDVRLAEEALPAGNEAFAIVEARSQADALAEALRRYADELESEGHTGIAAEMRWVADHRGEEPPLGLASYRTEG